MFVITLGWHVYTTLTDRVGILLGLVITIAPTTNGQNVAAFSRRRSWTPDRMVAIVGIAPCSTTLNSLIQWCCFEGNYLHSPQRYTLCPRQLRRKPFVKLIRCQERWHWSVSYASLSCAKSKGSCIEDSFILYSVIFPGKCKGSRAAGMF